MRRLTYLGRVLWLSILGFCCSLSALANTDKVIRVIDGDTLVLERIGTARLIGVDAPETVHPQKPVEFFGREASEFTRRHLEGKTVRLEYDWPKTDKYDRTLVYLFLEDGTFFNGELVKQGYAHAYTQFPFKYLDDFRRYEREARENQRGLWGVDVPGTKTIEEVVEEQATDEQGQTVYVTRTGSKYHRGSCRYLTRSKIPVSLKAAASGYGPCSVCRPPVLKSGSGEQPKIGIPTYSGRCQAITQKGTQCASGTRRPGAAIVGSMEDSPTRHGSRNLFLLVVSSTPIGKRNGKIRDET